MLPDADTILQKLAIPAITSRVKLDCHSIVHLLPTYTHDYLQQLSHKLSLANCLRVLMHHMMNWTAAERLGVQITTKGYEEKTKIIVLNPLQEN